MKKVYEIGINSPSDFTFKIKKVEIGKDEKLDKIYGDWINKGRPDYLFELLNFVKQSCALKNILYLYLTFFLISNYIYLTH